MMFSLNIFSLVLAKIQIIMNVIMVYLLLFVISKSLLNKVLKVCSAVYTLIAITYSWFCCGLGIVTKV
jgi:hypothetical protein